MKKKTFITGELQWKVVHQTPPRGKEVVVWQSFIVVFLNILTLENQNFWHTGTIYFKLPSLKPLFKVFSECINSIFSESTTTLTKLFYLILLKIITLHMCSACYFCHTAPILFLKQKYCFSTKKTDFNWKCIFLVKKLAVFDPKNGNFSKSLKLPQKNFIWSVQTKNSNVGWRNLACSAKKNWIFLPKNLSSDPRETP